MRLTVVDKGRKKKRKKKKKNLRFSRACALGTVKPCFVADPCDTCRREDLLRRRSVCRCPYRPCPCSPLSIPTTTTTLLLPVCGSYTRQQEGSVKVTRLLELKAVNNTCFCPDVCCTTPCVVVLVYCLTCVVMVGHFTQ